MMQNCTLLPALQTSSSYRYNSPEVYISNSKLVQVIESTLNKVRINVQSHSMLFTDRCTFINSSTAAVITRDSYSTIILNNCSFLNNYARSDYGIVYTRGALSVNNCHFDGNSVAYSSGAVVYSTGDIIITGSSFIRNRASSVRSSRPVSYAYYEGGSAIRGGRNINISNCTFSHYTRSSQIVYSYRYSSYRSQGSYRVYIVNSTFYNSSSRSIYSYNNDVILVNSSFYNVTSRGGGGAVYSTRTVTTINFTFINSTTVNSNGGVIYHH